MECLPPHSRDPCAALEGGCGRQNAAQGTAFEIVEDSATEAAKKKAVGCDDIQLSHLWDGEK